MKFLFILLVLLSACQEECFDDCLRSIKNTSGTFNGSIPSDKLEWAVQQCQTVCSSKTTK